MRNKTIFKAILGFGFFSINNNYWACEGFAEFDFTSALINALPVSSLNKPFSIEEECVRNFIVQNYIKNYDENSADLLKEPFTSGIVSINRLSRDNALITLRTNLAAYQAMGLYFVYDINNLNFKQVYFDKLNNTTIKEHAVVKEYEQNLDYKILDDNKIVITSKSRGAGGCGSFAIYEYKEGFFKNKKYQEFKCEE